MVGVNCNNSSLSVAGHRHSLAPGASVSAGAKTRKAKLALNTAAIGNCCSGRRIVFSVGPCSGEERQEQE